jgi:hypothetical protein
MEPTTESGYLRFGTFELSSSTRVKYVLQIACVMCLNLLIGAGSIAVIGRLLRDVQNASEAAYMVLRKRRHYC